MADLLISALRDQFLPGLRLEETVAQQIQRYRNDVRELEEFLRVAETSQTADERIQLLEREIRGVLYRFDNVVDTFTLVEDESGGENSFGRFLSKLASSAESEHIMRGITSDLEEIRTKIDYLFRLIRVVNFHAIGFQREISGAAEHDPELTSDLLDQEHFVGRVEEKELLRARILDPECHAIAIWGIGGMGKTMLARCLFRELREKHCFDAFAWVRFDKKLSILDVLLHLCKQLIGLGHDGDLLNLDQVQLLSRIRGIQERQRCLLFIDDLWSSHDCVEYIAFGSRSKLLVTTRAAAVALKVASYGYVHKIRPFTEEEGCTLFQERVLRTHGQDFEVNEVLKEIGKKLAKFCGGLPLAIVNFQEFMETKHITDVSKITSPESVFRESLETGGRRSLLRVMVSIYDNLTPDLRRCFPYLGHFPDNCPIDFEKLYLFWLSDGIISLENNAEYPIDVAERFLYYLAERGIIELHKEEIPTITRFKSCQLNPVIRELSLLKNKEQGFFNVVDFGRGTDLVADSLFSSARTETYRFSINLDKYEERYGFPMANDQKKNIRCLLLSVKENQQGLIWPKKLLNLAEFKYLRILNFDGFDFRVTKLPRGLEKLRVLRFLSFSDCILPRLPSSIANLTFLYILDLRVDCSSKIIIPNVLWKIKRLRHLYLPLSFEIRNGAKLRLAGLRDLETLTNFNAALVNIADLLTLSKLSYLALNIVGDIEEINCLIERMNMDSEVRSLRVSLEIMNFDCYTEERHSVLRKLLECPSLIALYLEGHIYRMPLYSKLSSNLAKIVLIGSELKEDPMKMLEKLPKLIVLVLDDDAFVGEELACSASSFKELKHLELLNLQYLHKWTVDQEALPKLSALTVRNCEKLMMLPEELQFVRRLHKVNVSLINEKFKLILRKIQEDGDYHGPSIKMED